MNATAAAPVRATKDPTRPKATTPTPTITEATPPAEIGSLIVLTLRPTGDKFNGNHIERADEAGFDWIPKAAAYMGFISPDTSEEIARLVVA